ncbi:MAG: cell division protein FtsL [Deltaproteobacteria bacterium]|nr:cell division protein FtsL [Deltaproteobacteria bacterium]
MQAILKKNSFTGVLGRQRVKDKRDVNSPWFLFSAIIVITVIAMVTLFYVWSRLLTINLGYEISRVELERKNLLKEKGLLNIEITSLKSPDRIDRIARTELGLVYPSQEQIIRIKEQTQQ